MIKDSIFNPPNMASIGSVLICLLGPLRDVLVDESTFINRFAFRAVCFVGEI